VGPGLYLAGADRPAEAHSLEPRLASVLAGLLCAPPILYILYRAIVPYERAMPDFRLAGALFFPAIAGFGLGVAHISFDTDLIFAGYGGTAFLLLYPAIETYAIIVIFNRNFFYKQPGTAIYFAVGGAGLALGLSFVEAVQALSAHEPADIPFTIGILALATAFVLFHSSKGLLIGTYFVEGARLRGVLVSIALEAPFGALYLTGKAFGADYAEIFALMVLYGALVYYMIWKRFFPRRMPEALRKALDKERKRQRRVVIAKSRK
jgi:hypothetical protein